MGDLLSIPFNVVNFDFRDFSIVSVNFSSQQVIVQCSK